MGLIIWRVVFDNLLRRNFKRTEICDLTSDTDARRYLGAGDFETILCVAHLASPRGRDLSLEMQGRLLPPIGKSRSCAHRPFACPPPVQWQRRANDRGRLFPASVNFLTLGLRRVAAIVSCGLARLNCHTTAWLRRDAARVFRPAGISRARGHQQVALTPPGPAARVVRSLARLSIESWNGYWLDSHFLTI